MSPAGGGPTGRARGRLDRVHGDRARRLALDLMARVEAGAYANIVVPRALGTSRLVARDRRLVTELVYGATRMRRACDWLVDRHLRHPVHDEDVRQALRLGAYQLAFTRVPPHAAVSTMVGLAPPRSRGLVNAVLRRVAGDLPPAWPDVATRLSYPTWMVELLEADLGEATARAAMEEMDRPAEAVARSDGYFQDRASQWVSALMAPGLGERVADLCAAPGGKATAMAGVRAASTGEGSTGEGSTGEGGGGGGPALVVAGDVRPRRARLVAANARRLHLDRVVPVVADGRRPPLAPRSLDRVLVDAPCSGLGSLRRRPDARWRAGPEDPSRLAVLQQELLAAAIGLLRPGGVLGYSVCTLTRRETLDVDEWLAAEHPELEALPAPGEPWAPWGRGALLLPHAAHTDGMYLLRLSRRHG